ncbi:MAG: hypothetical protein WD266_01440 [Balneolales bacterium]
MFATIIFILGIYLLFRFVDEGLGMFDSTLLTLRRFTKRRKSISNNPEQDHHWKGIMIGFFVGVFFMLLLLAYHFYTK